MSNQSHLLRLLGLCLAMILWTCKSSKPIAEAPDKECNAFKRHWEMYAHYVPNAGIYYLSDTLAEWVDPEAVRQYRPSDNNSGEPATRFEMWTPQLMKDCFIGKTPKEVMDILGPPSRFVRGLALYEVACRRRTNFCYGQGGISVDTSALVINRVEQVPYGVQILP